MPLLEMEQCGVQFGGLTAVEDFWLSVDATELVGIIGPNGAGKTTIFNLITGITSRPTATSTLGRAH